MTFERLTDYALSPRSTAYQRAADAVLFANGPSREACDAAALAFLCAVAAHAKKQSGASLLRSHHDHTKRARVRLRSRSALASFTLLCSDSPSRSAYSPVGGVSLKAPPEKARCPSGLLLVKRRVPGRRSRLGPESSVNGDNRPAARRLAASHRTFEVREQPVLQTIDPSMDRHIGP